jgi:SAM-dependent methyltransferase
MHDTSFASMAHMVRAIRKSAGERAMQVLDVGSMVAKPEHVSFRRICALPGMTYTGLDVAPGPNVDVVATDPYVFPIAAETYDLVISGSVFEHIEFPWLTMLEVARVMKPGAFAVIIAPSSGPEHRYPTDCWRYYPDGMRALAKWAKLECADVVTGWHESKIFMFGDTIGLFYKPMTGHERPTVSIGDARRHQGASSALRQRYIDFGAWLLRLYKKIGRRFLTDIY